MFKRIYKDEGISLETVGSHESNPFDKQDEEDMECKHTEKDVWKEWGFPYPKGDLFSELKDPQTEIFICKCGAIYIWGEENIQRDENGKSTVILSGEEVFGLIKHAMASSLNESKVILKEAFEDAMEAMEKQQ